MHRDSERHKLFSRRAAMLAGGKALLLSTLVGRMYYLQVVESSRYKTLADENRINLRLLAPPRGRIVDRFGRAMADNQQNYRAVVIPEQAGDLSITLNLLSKIIPMGDKDWRRILREAKRKRAFVPITVRENLSWGDVARIEVNTPDLPGVLIDVGQSRNYIYGEEVAHVMGYVAAVSEKEISDDPLLELPGFRIGKAGIEKVYDMQLRGTGGSSQVEVNALGRVIRELARQEGQPGNEVRLTINLDLQRFVSKLLGKESASVVVVDVHSGDVLAMVSSPSFDPNMFNKGLDQAQWDALIHNKKSPLTNKAISGQYSPGSTFKMAVALAALEKGSITPETKIHCSGSTKLGNAEFHCWKRGGHGSVNMEEAIEQSCDVYFYETARRAGIDRISAMGERLGMGKSLDLGLPGEKHGLMPTRKWKMGELNEPWQMGETMIAGIGQGYVLTTPLQLAIMTARIANGGFQVFPRLVVNEDGEDASDNETELKSIGVAPEYLQIVKNGMNNVVNGKKGTARKARISEVGMEMAGKTGTVQVRRISKLERETGVLKNDELPWKERDHALFVGYGPVENPRFAVSVVVEHGGSGSGAAAPLARDILLEAQKLALSTPAPAPVSREANSKVMDKDGGEDVT
ncbi:MAG: penicillin-binding protein 2 [Rhodospirillaceae bacterium]|nr:penicillin-binding protein 2 [Rhodospirillaceae bacterium]